MPARLWYRACLVRYLKGKVQDRSWPIKCPHFCPSRTIGLSTLKRYLSPEVRNCDHVMVKVMM